MLYRTVLTLLVASATAFTASKPTLVRPVTMPSTTARHIIMTDKETDTILQSAKDCVDSECSIDEVDSLLETLKSAEADLRHRLDKIDELIGELQHINEKPERKTSEVRQFVQDLMLVFSQKKPKVSPTGWSGDVTKHLTAYDALPPKPWKASP
ncbi:hypothetical protein IV203_010451 [Nitzschia inconspicua]|uniref:Secreted protein n=1 Tax=Nitzschia inconspicua TaxID=303405 RepID=A0A9K3KXK6_9STRA|nr:hypothetical protein IV203_010451 [Nitzschia inconspicua]